MSFFHSPSALLLNQSVEAKSEVLGPVLGSPVQKRHGHTEINPVKGHKNAECAGESVI